MIGHTVLRDPRLEDLNDRIAISMEAAVSMGRDIVCLTVLEGALGFVATIFWQQRPPCGSRNGSWSCDRFKGHDGDHWEMAENGLGGKIGWGNKR